MRHKLGLGTIIGLVIANMIGAGVFTTSGFAMGDLGSPLYVILAWLAGGVIAFCGAISYGALSRLMPVSGGEYLFLSRSIHPLMGFIAGWISLLAGFTGAIAYAAITMEVYLVPTALRSVITENAIATVTILSAALIHGIRVSHGVIIQNLTVAVKLILIGCFLTFAAFGPALDSWDGIRAFRATGLPDFSMAAFATTLMWISFSYSGFNAAIYVASEVDNAGVVIPKAMVYATLITTIIYLLLNAVFVFAPAPDAINRQEDVAAIAAIKLGGDFLAHVIRGIIVVALFTTISAMIMAGPRVYAQMAEDGLLPEALRFTRQAPDVSIALQSLLAVMVVWITGLRELLSYLGFTLGLSAAATITSLFVIVRRDPNIAHQLPGFPWSPAVFVFFTLVFAGVAATRNPWEMFAAVLTIVSGIIIFLLFNRARPRVSIETTKPSRREET
jgi:APA family basic amino acid/polyamine antiporter